jgi:signal transduction histidine kinase
LVAALLNLQLTSERMLSDPSGAHVMLRAALQNVREGLEELRELAAGLHPSILSRGGLGAAVQALASRSHIAVTVRAPAKRYPERVEVAAYFVVAEALTNVVKHAHASHADVDIHDEAESLVVQVADDGVGGATSERGSGLRGLEDRLETAAGRLWIESALGGGTRVVAALPVS